VPKAGVSADATKADLAKKDPAQQQQQQQ